MNDHIAKTNLASPHFANVNYADIDELYQTIIIRRFPQTARAPFFTTCGIFPITWPLGDSLWITSRRRVPKFELLEDEETGEFVVRPPLVKTYPEKMNWLMPCRLFLFNFHSHAMIFILCIVYLFKVRTARRASRVRACGAVGHVAAPEWARARGGGGGGRPGQRVEEQGTWASRTQKHSEAGYGRPVDRGAWTAKTVERPRQQPAHPQ